MRLRPLSRLKIGKRSWRHSIQGKCHQDKKQPKAEEKADFLDDLSNTLVTARKICDSGGKITMRRLNRREYVNTMQDLLGVTEP